MKLGCFDMTSQTSEQHVTATAIGVEAPYIYFAAFQMKRDASAEVPAQGNNDGNSAIF